MEFYRFRKSRRIRYSIIRKGFHKTLSLFSCFLICHLFQKIFFYFFFQCLFITLWFCSKVPSVSLTHFIFLINLSENHEVMKLLFWIFWSAHNLCLLYYEVYIQSVISHPFLSRIHPYFSLFWLHFLEVIYFCISRIWMDKSSALNNYFFYFQPKLIKLALNCLHICFSL